MNVRQREVVEEVDTGVRTPGLRMTDDLCVCNFAFVLRWTVKDGSSMAAYVSDFGLLPNHYAFSSYKCKLFFSNMLGRPILSAPV